jgi:hypothetical protein
MLFKRIYPFVVSVVFIALSASFLSAETGSIQTSEANIFFEKPLTPVAREIADIYSAVSSELSRTFRWEIAFRPDIILAKDRDTFRKMVGSDSILAFAVPERTLIVLDTSRVYTKPFTLRTTLKHELCHLVLHRNIQGDRLPRWLDEGICQWASGGLAELMSEDSDKSIAQAAASDMLIPMRELERFPDEDKSLVLAYEESKSFVEYLISRSGEEAFLQAMGYFKQGNSLDEAIQRSFSMSLHDLEQNWQARLKRKYTWFYYFSNNLYTILFVFAALITVYGFIRLLQKKRAYKDEEEVEKEEEGRGGSGG